jgi:segregation and condensation protein B
MDESEGAAAGTPRPDEPGPASAGFLPGQDGPYGRSEADGHGEPDGHGESIGLHKLGEFGEPDGHGEPIGLHKPDGLGEPNGRGKPAGLGEPNGRDEPDGHGEGGPDELDEPDIADGPSLRASVEAILLVADEPVPAVVIAQVLERPTEEVSSLLRDLSAAYTADGRGFDLREIAGGWRFYTREECAPVVERFVSEGQEVRLTQAALETLAVVAYRQPVSRARVSAVRGVNCDGVMRTLTLRGLVEDAGTDPETGAILYRTTSYFLERLGLASLDELPDLAPFLPENIEDVDDTEDVGHERARP